MKQPKKGYAVSGTQYPISFCNVCVDVNGANVEGIDVLWIHMRQIFRNLFLLEASECQTEATKEALGFFLKPLMASEGLSEASDGI